ncbi:hypothetical protein CASFOL_032020 [Castilleja foliolosa]|uniref:Ubiquitin-like protease family profile domain-containing protein n=1 Tax=Castilleja foliolosa TaxID=1961234 RepID=A0ABD3C0V9_9LAMI
MGLLATGTISASVMKFYNKCLYNILKSSGRADRYGLMCPLIIQTHGNSEDMGFIRNRIGEGAKMIESAFEAYHLVKGLPLTHYRSQNGFIQRCCQQDVGDAECGLFVMRHMLEIIKLDIANSFEKDCT